MSYHSIDTAVFLGKFLFSLVVAIVTTVVDRHFLRNEYLQILVNGYTAEGKKEKILGRDVSATYFRILRARRIRQTAFVSDSEGS